MLVLEWFYKSNKPLAVLYWDNIFSHAHYYKMYCLCTLAWLMITDLPCKTDQQWQ